MRKSRNSIYDFCRESSRILQTARYVLLLRQEPSLIPCAYNIPYYMWGEKISPELSLLPDSPSHLVFHSPLLSLQFYSILFACMLKSNPEISFIHDYNQLFTVAGWVLETQLHPKLTLPSGRERDGWGRRWLPMLKGLMGGGAGGGRREAESLNRYFTVRCEHASINGWSVIEGYKRLPWIDSTHHREWGKRDSLSLVRSTCVGKGGRERGRGVNSSWGKGQGGLRRGSATWHRAWMGMWQAKLIPADPLCCRHKDPFTLGPDPVHGYKSKARKLLFLIHLTGTKCIVQTFVNQPNGT